MPQLTQRQKILIGVAVALLAVVLIAQLRHRPEDELTDQLKESRRQYCTNSLVRQNPSESDKRNCKEFW